ncbi:uncharacterized protein THITE_2096963, partial [Thermothielavioides terrestris NRRL 8126]
MPVNGRKLRGIILLDLALLSGALGRPAVLARADNGGEISPPPRQTTAKDIVAALITIFIAVTIVAVLIRWLIRTASAQVQDLFHGLSDEDSDEPEFYQYPIGKPPDPGPPVVPRSGMSASVSATSLPSPKGNTPRPVGPRGPSSGQ